MASQNMKRDSTTLVIIKMQIKITMDDFIQPLDWIKLKVNNNKYWPGWEVAGMLIHWSINRGIPFNR